MVIPLMSWLCFRFSGSDDGATEMDIRFASINDQEDCDDDEKRTGAVTEGTRQTSRPFSRA